MRNKAIIIGLAISTILLFITNLFFGSVAIPAEKVWASLTGQLPDTDSYSYIILENRLPQAVTALLAGASLAVAGLLLQTAFHNPLAGPSILGITSGASLGVALVTLVSGGVVATALHSFSGSLLIVIVAMIGSLTSMLLLIFLSVTLRNNLMLLIVGILISNLTNAVISLLNFYASAQDVQSFMLWGLGSFSGVSYAQLPIFATLSLAGLFISVLMIKPLNIIELGDNYSRNLGLNINRMRNMLLLATGILTAVVTAFCGPIAFIGLAVPHIARLFFTTSNQRTLMPGIMLTGATIALLCNLISVTPSNVVLPLNAITPLMGIPVILYVIFRSQAR